jgi:hypothetical protein
MIIKFEKYKLNENAELAGKHSFFTFLQIISNHDYHFILNDHYTKLYKYHMFFSTETIKDLDEIIDVFKYKQSLSSAYKILLEIKGNKIAYFFGVKDDSTLRYGFLDVDTQRSYVIGEFEIYGDYFKSVSKYNALSYINKIVQNLDVKNLPLLAKIKQDFKDFYTSKKSSKVKIDDNRVISYFSKEQFTEEDLRLNRPYRILDQWIAKKSWKNKVECSVDDTTDPIQFIILIK